MRTIAAFSILCCCLLLAGCGSSQDSAASHLETAQEFFAEGDLMRAKLEARNALQLEPKNVEARYLMALISETERDAQGTLGNLQLALDSDPDFLPARIKLGTYYVVGRRPIEAREFADKALAAAPDNADVRLLSAKVLLLEDRQAEALEEASLALSMDPVDREIIGFTALLYARSGDMDRAMNILDEGIAVADKADVEYLRQSRVSILAELGEREPGVAELEQLVEDYPESLNYQMALAEVYMADGRNAEAEALIKGLIARDPENTDWRMRLARLQVSQGRTEDAEVSLRQAVAERPDSQSLQLALAGFYESVNKSAEAVTVYEAVAAREPRSSEGLTARNRLAALLIGDEEERAREINASILTDSPDNVDGLLFRAALRIADGQNDDAISDLRLALAKQPNSIRALLGLARAQLLNGNPVLAEDAYRKALAGEPGNVAATRELAVVLGKRGDTEEAEVLLRQALRIQPDNPVVASNLVSALLLQEDYDTAEAEARRMAEDNTSSGMPDYQLGLALEAQGDAAEAIDAYRLSLEKSPEAAAPLTNLTRLLIRTGRADEAVTYLGQHLALYPEGARAGLLLAEVYASQGEIELAQTTYRGLLAEQPDLVGAYIGLAGLYSPTSEERLDALAEGARKIPGSPELGLALGSTYEGRGEYEQGIQAYERALQAADNDIIATNLAALLLDYRDDAQSHAQALKLASRFEARGEWHPLNLAVLGWGYYRNGDYSLATRYLERAAAGAPQNAQLRYYLGMAYLRGDNPRAARQELKLAVDGAAKSGQTFTGLDQAQRELEQLTPKTGPAASIAEPVSEG